MSTDPGYPREELYADEHDANFFTQVPLSFLQLCEEVGNRVSSIVQEMDRIREPVRTSLQSCGWIQQIPDHPSTDYTIAAVDGSNRVESSFAGDLMVATATSAPGLHSSGELKDITESWADFSAHSFDASEAARIHMFCRELHVLNNIDYDMRIIDGTHVNPLAAIIRGLRGSHHLQQTTAGLLENFDVHEAVTLLAAPHSGVISLAKADTSTHIVEMLRSHPTFHSMPTVVDKMLAALVLEPGEVILPLPSSPHLLEMIINSACGTSNPEFKAAESGLVDALMPLSQVINEGRLFNAYLKPVTMVTTLKMQFVASTSDPYAAFEEIGATAGAISRECYGPELLEPYPQYTADMKAKGTRSAIRLLRQQISSSSGVTSSPYTQFYLMAHRS